MARRKETGSLPYFSRAAPWMGVFGMAVKRSWIKG
jgi:hypothetical protein